MAADFEFADDVLEEVELFVTGGCPELVAFVFLFLSRNLAVITDNGVAAFFAEGRVGEDEVELSAAGLGEGIGFGDRRVFPNGCSNAV